MTPSRLNNMSKNFTIIPLQCRGSGVLDHLQRNRLFEDVCKPGAFLILLFLSLTAGTNYESGIIRKNGPKAVEILIARQKNSVMLQAGFYLYNGKRKLNPAEKKRPSKPTHNGWNTLLLIRLRHCIPGILNGNCQVKILKLLLKALIWVL